MDRNSIIHAKPLPQPPYQASAWSYRYGFREIMIFSSSKNRLRSRTRVTTFKFQNALGLKHRLRFRTRATTLMTKNVLETRLRACIQRAVFCIHELKAKP